MSEPLRYPDAQDEKGLLREILQALAGLKYGSLEITVHNGQVVQIERKENFVCKPP